MKNVLLLLISSVTLLTACTSTQNSHKSQFLRIQRIVLQKYTEKGSEEFKTYHYIRKDKNFAATLMTVGDNKKIIFATAKNESETMNFVLLDQNGNARSGIADPSKGPEDVIIEFMTSFQENGTQLNDSEVESTLSAIQ